MSLGLLAWVLRSADLSRARGLVRALGLWLPLLLVPNLIAILTEAAGWWLSFDRLGGRPRFRSLASVRVIGDALMLGLPSGAVVSETVQPWLLKRRCGVPTENGIVATVARKFFVVGSQGLFLALATILAWPLLDRASRTAIGRVGLPVLLLTTAFVLVTVAILLGTATAMGQVADRVHRVLGGRHPPPGLDRRRPAGRVDNPGSDVPEAAGRLISPTLPAVCGAMPERHCAAWVHIRRNTAHAYCALRGFIMWRFHSRTSSIVPSADGK